MTESNHPLESEDVNINHDRDHYDNGGGGDDDGDAGDDQEFENPNRLFCRLDNEVIDTVFVKTIILPSMTFRQTGVVDERSSILLTLEPCQTAYKQVMTAAKEGFRYFKIHYVNVDEEIQSTWELHGAAVEGLELGIISMDPEEPPPILNCAIIFETLEIDGVRL